MKAGDLVKPKWGTPLDDPERPKLGLLMEWDVTTDQSPAAGWVKWNGEYSWDIVYEDDLELVCEAKYEV